MPKPKKHNSGDDDIDWGALDGDSAELDASLDEEMDGLDGGSDPLEGIERTGNVVEDAPKEISASLAAFKAAARNEQQQFADNTDSEYWTCLVFQNRAQKEAFLSAMGWFENGDKYLDGEWVAEKMKVKLPPSNQRFYTEKEEAKVASLPRIRNKPAKGNE